MPENKTNRLKSFLFVYQTGPDPIPADRVQENRRAWRTWSINLREKYGIHTAGGKLISEAGTTDYTGDIRGASMVDAESLEAALEIARNSPNLPFGGSIIVLQEYERPDRTR